MMGGMGGGSGGFDIGSLMGGMGGGGDGDSKNMAKELERLKKMLAAMQQEQAAKGSAQAAANQGATAASGSLQAFNPSSSSIASSLGSEGVGSDSASIDAIGDFASSGSGKEVAGAIGSAWGPMGQAIGEMSGAATDAIVSTTLNAIYGRKRAKKKKEKKKRQRLREAWANQAAAGANRAKFEQEAISRMMNIGR